ncbi:MAG: winged helix-turn-helix transcriptional regulator [Alphaproteobacteria bacterium]|nr:winged helix-turn-helix transcriptional regulator [Alphaproteobacteria bacterium]MCB9696002.1 winged helix-turn-helix transcriptional regulator [Alphaproteobacteria bacterium]
MDHDEAMRRAAAASTGQLLLKAARLLDETALSRLAALPGAPPVRPAHTRLFPHLDFTGVRATELAARLGVTKQAVAPLVADLVRWGVVEQVPDPTDRRALLVRFTPHGLEALRHGLSLLADLEGEVAADVGAERMAVFRDVLVAWIRRLTEPQRTQR